MVLFYEQVCVFLTCSHLLLYTGLHHVYRATAA